MESGTRKTELKAITGLAVAALIACFSQLQDSGINHLPNGYTRALRIIQSVETVKRELPSLSLTNTLQSATLV